MTYNEQLTEILSIRWNGTKVYGLGNGNKGTKTFWDIPDHVRKELAAAITALNAETIGEDDPEPPTMERLKSRKNAFRADLRQRFGVEE